MAVYTDVTDEALFAFLADLRSRRRPVLQGHSRRGRKLQFPAALRGGLFHPHPLRKAGQSGRPAVLHRPDGASGRARPLLPAAGKNAATARRWANWPGGPPRSSPFSTASRPASPTPHHCLETGRALAQLHLAGEGFALAPRQRAVAGALARPVRGLARPAPTRSSPGLADEIAAELDGLAAALAAATCRRASSTPISSRTMCSSSAKSCPA